MLTNMVAKYITLIDGVWCNIKPWESGNDN